jgi:transcriptional regulator with XRE-family HTH domain
MDFKEWLRETMTKHGLSDLDVQNRTKINRSLIWHYKQGSKNHHFRMLVYLRHLFAKVEGEAENLDHRQVYFLRLELIYKMFEMLEGGKMNN